MSCCVSTGVSGLLLKSGLARFVLLFTCLIQGAALVAQNRPELMTQEAYVWQRAWNSQVARAIDEHGSRFAELIVLNEEISFDDGRPSATQVSPDFGVLGRVLSKGRGLGLALRIGPFSGPFTADDSVAKFICDEAASLLKTAQAHGANAAELQIDFDCAESKLKGYLIWIQALRKRIAPVPLTITVLPSWLRQGAFKDLVAATDGYVLQVHSVERPQSIRSPFTLCDPAKAKQWVEQAGALRIPFRVALPTYGYQVAYDSAGRFAGLAAEGTARRSWAPGTQLREVRSDPLQMAGLVQYWVTNRPSSIKGILWYRFPMPGDILNWRWPTLAAIMAARSPKEEFRAESRRVEAGLVEISLVNSGELDISSRLAVEARWSRDSGSRLVAADGLHGFQVVDGGPSALQLKSESQFSRLPAGESQVIGWLRFDKDREVEVEVKKQ